MPTSSPKITRIFGFLDGCWTLADSALLKRTGRGEGQEFVRGAQQSPVGVESSVPAFAAVANRSAIRSESGMLALPRPNPLWVRSPWRAGWEASTFESCCTSSCLTLEGNRPRAIAGQNRATKAVRDGTPSPLVPSPAPPRHPSPAATTRIGPDRHARQRSTSDGLASSQSRGLICLRRAWRNPADARTNVPPTGSENAHSVSREIRSLESWGDRPRSTSPLV